MLTHTSIRSDLSRLRLGVAQVFVGGLGVFALILTVVFGLATLLAVVCGLVISLASASAGVEPSGHFVNRTIKGDRLARIAKINIPLAPAVDLELADGCESLVSSLAHTPFATKAGRCVS